MSDSPEYIRGYETGYTDCQAGKPPVYPTPTPTPTPTPAYIKSGTDLAPLVSSAVAGAILNCEPGGTFSGNGTFGPGADGVTVNLNGGTWNLLSAPGSGTNIYVKAKGFSINNGRLVGVQQLTNGTKDPLGSVVIRTQASGTCANGVVFAKCGTAFQTEAVSATVGGTFAQVVNCKVEASKKVAVYFDQSGFGISGTSIGPSDLEYGLRVTMPSVGTKPVGWTITDVTVDNPRSATNTSKDGGRSGAAAAGFCIKSLNRVE